LERMPLAAGQLLSYYEILGSLGAGAMGEVYRAEDTRLNREVAIKVLPEHFAESEERLQRFEREAKALASLNHPNVAQIFGVDRVEETCFLVLELVPGETLEERIARAALPVDEALSICAQIAEALEAAHEAGVIHRDLKPANVRVTPDGKAKVLDFGLAKPNSRTGASDSDSVLSTEQGRLLGTPTYMAPEQARGKPIDRRVDVWGFGCVLFECLTATRAFKGETLSDVLAAVLHDEPDWTKLPPATPRTIRGLLETCLQKDPRRRLRDMGDAWLELTRSDDLDSVQLPTADSRSRLVLVGVVAVLIGVLVGFFAGRAPGSAVPTDGPVLTSLHVPADLGVRLDSAPVLALSPDGKTLAWVGGATGEIYVRSLDSFEIRSLPATHNAVCPFFSPDSKRVGFWKEGELMSVALSGGAPTKIADVPTKPKHYRGAAWGDDGTIVLAPSIASPILRVPASGGELEPVTTLDPNSNVRTHRYPSIVPGAGVVLYTRDDKRTPEYHDDASIVAHVLSTGEERVVVEGAGQARFAAGYLVFVREACLYAVPFDTEALAVTGSPRKIVDGVECLTTNGVAQFDVAVDGTLLYQPGLDRAQAKRLVWREPGAEPEFLELPPGPYESPRVSPDGRYVSYLTLGPDLSELWVYSLERRTTRMLLRKADILTPIWSPTSDRLYFGSGLGLAPGLHELELSGSGPPRSFFKLDAGSFVTPADITKDGATVIAVIDNKLGQVDIVGVDVEAGQTNDIVASSHVETQAALDPSGEWITFVRLRDGQGQVYLTSLEAGGPVVQVSHEAARGPHWSTDGKAIYFLRSGTRELWVADVELEGTPRIGKP